MIEKNQTSVFQMNYHLVFVTKYRKPVFVGESLQSEMVDLFKSYAQKHDIRINEIEVMPDHVHILLSFPPKYSATDVVRKLKGATARTWFKHHPETKNELWNGHLWHRSYYIGTLGEMSRQTVQNYIQNQKQEPPLS